MVPSLKAFGLAEFSEGQKNMGRSSPIQLGMDSPKSSSAQQPRSGPGKSEQSAPRRPSPPCPPWCCIRRAVQRDPLRESGPGQDASAVHLARAAFARTSGSH